MWNERDVVVDADAIFTFQCVRRLNSNADICIGTYNHYYKTQYTHTYSYTTPTLHTK